MKLHILYYDLMTKGDQLLMIISYNNFTFSINIIIMRGLGHESLIFLFLLIRLHRN